MDKINERRKRAEEKEVLMEFWAFYIMSWMFLFDKFLFNEFIWGIYSIFVWEIFLFEIFFEKFIFNKSEKFL